MHGRVCLEEIEYFILIISNHFICMHLISIDINVVCCVFSAWN